MTEEEMQAIFPLAKLGVLFHVPRLKRTSHGRPTGVRYFNLFTLSENYDGYSRNTSCALNLIFLL
jgi:hypothetical protein